MNYDKDKKNKTKNKIKNKKDQTEIHNIKIFSKKRLFKRRKMISKYLQTWTNNKNIKKNPITNMIKNIKTNMILMTKSKSQIKK